VTKVSQVLKTQQREIVLKYLFIAFTLLSSSVLANTSSFSFDLEKVSLMESLPTIVSSILNGSNNSNDTDLDILINDTPIEKFDSEKLKTLPTSALSKVRYIPPNEMLSKGKLLLEVNEI
jgi:hypothetical protein